MSSGNMFGGTDDAVRSLFNARYSVESWHPITLRPFALSTSRHDAVARLLLGERGRLLDVGCGSGQLVLALADHFDELTGVDASDLRLERAHKALVQHYQQHLGKVRFIATRADREIPLRDASVDVVVCSAVLEFVADIFTAADEIARVCRPGGCVIVSVSNVCFIRNVLAMLGGHVPLTASSSRDISYWRRHGWNGDALRYFSKETLGDLLESVGLKPEAWAGSGRWAKLRSWRRNFCGDLIVRARKTG